jgi:membrane protein YqaA with SNARE-associated domain
MTSAESIGFWVIVAGVAVMGANVAYYLLTILTLRLKRRWRRRQQRRFDQMHDELIRAQTQVLRQRRPIIVGDDGPMH